jgi:hypothetical protein
MKSMEELVEKFKDSHQIKAGEVLFPAETAKAVIEDFLDKEVELLGVDTWYQKEGGICEDPGGLDLSQGLTPDTPEAARKIAKAFIDNISEAKPQIKFFSLVF